MRSENRLLWGNLGLWCRGDLSYPEACEALARYVAELGKLDPSDRLLVIGFGQGAELDFWKKEYGVYDIVGLEPEKSSFNIAKEFLRQTPGIELINEDHRMLPSLGLFDKIISLDAAYHFERKDRFFKSVKQCLKPSGHLVVNDLFLKEKSYSADLLFFSNLMNIPIKNWQPVEALHDMAFEAGLDMEAFENQSELVLGGYSHFIRSGGKKRQDVYLRHGFIKSWATSRVIERLRRHCDIQYGTFLFGHC